MFEFPKKYITNLISVAVKEFSKDKVLDVDAGSVPIEIDFKNNRAFGDCSSNVAFSLSKAFRMSSTEIAGYLKALIESQTPIFLERVEIAGGGFLNFYFTTDYFSKALFALTKMSAKDFKTAKKEKIIIEYSSPNVAKPMHVGHLRNTILGDALANLYDFLGYKVIRWNHIGDWGTQFGSLICAYKKWGDKIKVEKNPIQELLELYVRFHKEAEQNPELEKESQSEFKKMEEGDKENLKLLNWFLKESTKEFNRLYRLLDIKKFDKEIGESFYSPMIPKIIKEMESDKMIKQSEGAWIVPLDAFNLPPAMIQKSDGATIYMTREIASLKYRLAKYNPFKILYVVGNEQALHFQQFFAIARLMGIPSEKLEHVKYELIVGADGKKLSTREGKIIPAQEIIDEAILTAQKIIDQKRKDVPQEKREKIAKDIAINSLKYFFLKDGRMTKIIFNLESMLSFNGNSAPYLNYTYARFSKILKKAGRIKKADVFLLENKDLELIKKILEFENVFEQSKNDSSLHHICEYLFSLANQASSFYESSPILNDPDSGRKNARLMLIKELNKVLEIGFEILGIKTLEEI